MSCDVTCDAKDSTAAVAMFVSRGYLERVLGARRAERLARGSRAAPRAASARAYAEAGGAFLPFRPLDEARGLGAALGFLGAGLLARGLA